MNRNRTYLVLAACLAASLFCLAYPIYVIRPFRYQGVRELAVALAVLQFRNVVTALCVLAALVVFVRNWRDRKAMAATFFVCVFTGLSHVNIYEQMFHPLGAPAVATAAETKLDAGEMVLAIHQGGEARAYPVRGIAYHHIVNDTVGGVPIVATY